MKRKVLALALAVLLLVFPFAACTDDGLTTIRLNEVTHSIFYAPMYIAINKGFMEEEGIKIELTNGGGADKVMTALTSNSADIGLMGPEATVYVNAQGKLDYPIIFGQLTKRDGSFLVGRNPEPDFKWSDLTGKHVLAGRQGGMPAMTLQYICNTAGLYHDDNIRLDTTVEFNLMGPVFDSNKAIDYTTLFEPLASEFVAAGKGHIVASVGQASGEVPYTCFSATKSYIEKNSAVIEAFLRAIIKGYRFMLNSTIDEVAAALQPSFETTAYASVKATLQSYIAIDAWCSTPIMTETSFEKLQDIMSNAGTLSQRADFTKMVDNSYARNALDQLIG